MMRDLGSLIPRLSFKWMTSHLVGGGLLSSTNGKAF
jgi:hypothetical protein